MPFQGYISSSDIKRLVTKAVDGGLIGLPRILLLNGIFRPFALGLPKVNDDLSQFNLDLIQLNMTERLADGQVPVVQFLKNCADQLRLRGLNEAEDFELLMHTLDNRVRGVPSLPDPSVLPEVVRKEAIIGVDDMVDFAFLAEGARAGQSVARIVVPRFENRIQKMTEKGAPWLMNGTAWIIQSDLMLTNHHVINARNAGEPAASDADFKLQGETAMIEFDFNSRNGQSVSIKSAEVISASSQLDYALFRLQRKPDRPPLQIFARLVESGPTTYLPVNIIQHPRGDPKKVAFRNNLVTGADTRIIRYFTDTDHGSSGSPVCDDKWQVVALHCGAQYVRDINFQGKPTAYVNFGTQIQAILADLKQKNITIV